MEQDYPDVGVKWKVHPFENKSTPAAQFELDWDLKILEGQLTGAERMMDDLEEIVHTQEDRLVKHTEPGSDGSTMLGRHHLTTRFKNWNMFYVDHPAVKTLWQVVKEGHDRYCDIHKYTPSLPPMVQSWANVLREGDDIGEHSHVHSPESAQVYMSTNFCVTADESTATVYDLPGYESRNAPFTNRPGQLIVFPSWIPHFTTPFEKEDSTRITIASDISFNDWSKLSFREGKRMRHWVPFDVSPPVKKAQVPEYESWGDVPAVDGTIAELVNYEGELNEEVVREMKETGTDFARENLHPEGVDLEENAE
jgi:hypothetical protein